MYSDIVATATVRRQSVPRLAARPENTKGEESLSSLLNIDEGSMRRNRDDHGVRPRFAWLPPDSCAKYSEEDEVLFALTIIFDPSSLLFPSSPLSLPSSFLLPLPLVALCRKGAVAPCRGPMPLLESAVMLCDNRR